MNPTYCTVQGSFEISITSHYYITKKKKIFLNNKNFRYVTGDRKELHTPSLTGKYRTLAVVRLPNYTSLS